MKVRFRKDLYRIVALSLILIIVFLAIAFIWKWLEIPKTPDPIFWKGSPKAEVWRKFFSISIPLFYGLFSLAYIILSKLIPEERADDLKALNRSHKYDSLTYLLIPLFLLIEVFWRHLGDWYLWFGAFYLSLVFIKTAIMASVIYRWIRFLNSENNPPIPPSIPPLVREEAEGLKGGDGGFVKSLPLHIRWGLFLLSFLFYASTSLWISYSISTTGDEPHYLLITHSLLYDRDFDLKNNIEQRDYQKFSWIYFSTHNLVEKKRKVYSTAYNTLFPVLLIPGYAVGGRLGALLIIDIFAALLLLELYLLTFKLSGFRRAAWLAFVLVGFTIPYFLFTSQVYPEIPAAFFLVFALRRWLSPGSLKNRSLILVSAAILITGLKFRFAPISLGLILLWSINLEWKKKLMIVALTAVSSIALIWMDKSLFHGVLLTEMFGSPMNILFSLIPKKTDLWAFAGLFFDQEFGLFFYSPLYILSLAGLPWICKTYRKKTLNLLLPTVIYIYILISFHYHDWYGGWSTPSRYIIVIAPIFGLMAAIAAQGGRFMSIFTSVSLIWGIILSFILTLVPIWRYNSASGANLLLKKAENIFPAKIARFFPSFISPAPEGSAVFLILLLLIIVSGIFLIYKPPTIDNRKKSKPFIIPAVLILPAIFLFLILLGRTLPTRHLEGEGMEHNIGTQYRDSEKNVWVMNEKGRLWDRVIFPKWEERSINIFTGGQCNTGEAPHIVVRIGESLIGEADLLYGKDSWLASSYTFKTPSVNGIKTFSIEFTNGTYDIIKNRYCGIYIDRIEFSKPGDVERQR